MDSKTFAKFCRDTKLLDKKFAAADADLIFQKTKAKASAPGAGAYSSGVVHGIKVRYDLFRTVALPSIAEKKGMSIMDLIRFLASAPGPSLNGVTQQEAVRFHDDKSTYTGAQASKAVGSSPTPPRTSMVLPPTAPDEPKSPAAPGSGAKESRRRSSDGSTPGPNTFAAVSEAADSTNPSNINSNSSDARPRSRAGSFAAEAEIVNSIQVRK